MATIAPAGAVGASAVPAPQAQKVELPKAQAPSEPHEAAAALSLIQGALANAGGAPPRLDVRI